MRMDAFPHPVLEVPHDGIPPLQSWGAGPFSIAPLFAGVPLLIAPSLTAIKGAIGNGPAHRLFNGKRQSCGNLRVRDEVMHPSARRSQLFCGVETQRVQPT